MVAEFQQVLTEGPDIVIPGARVVISANGIAVTFPDGFWTDGRRARHMQALVATVDSALDFWARTHPAADQVEPLRDHGEQ